mgnify:FL=1
MKILILGASNSNRPPSKCWPEYVADYFCNIKIRNAAFRGCTTEHLYDCYMANEPFNPDLILCDIPPWYRSHIPVSLKTQEVKIDKVHQTNNYEYVDYKLMRGVVPIGGYIADNNNLLYSDWLKNQIMPGRKISLHSVLQSRAADRSRFDDLINLNHALCFSDYYKNKSIKDIQLLKYAIKDIPIYFIHTIGPVESLDVGNYLCENAYNYLDGTLCEDEWVHLSAAAHEKVSKELYIPAIDNLLGNDFLGTELHY